MAEFVKVAKEYRRMCNSYLSCGNCPLDVNVRSSQLCKHDVLLDPEESERIIMKWAAEHPIKTNGMKFREVFGQQFEQLFAVGGVEAQWLHSEYKGGQDEQD